jgi:hypothetical protein
MFTINSTLRHTKFKTEFKVLRIVNLYFWRKPAVFIKTEKHGEIIIRRVSKNFG